MGEHLAVIPARQGSKGIPGKALRTVAGVPMVERVRRNLPKAEQLVVIALAEHADHIRSWLKDVDKQGLYQHIHTAYIPEVTAGAACTVYGVIEDVNPESELLVANCDQWIDWSPAHFIDYCRRMSARPTGVDGVIPTFRATGNKWSYLDLRDDGTVRRVVEKPAVPPSDIATCGIYWWRMAKDCFDSIELMVKDGDTTNGEYFLSPSYNKLIDMAGQFIPYPVPRMVGLGTPEDLTLALDSGVFGDGKSPQA